MTTTQDLSKVKIPMEPISGCRDFFPDDMVVLNWIIDNWKETSKRYGFQQYDAPIVEHAELYTHKGGDDILNEMFVFKDSDQTVALRPEMTPTVSRMVMNYMKSAVLPLKWFSVPQCWRNETVSRGRRREFYQWNVDVFGAERIKADIEILAIVVHFLESIGFHATDVVLKVSNRMILQKVFEKYGIESDKIPVAFNIIDKLNKNTREELTELLRTTVGMTCEAINTVFDIVEVKDTKDLVKFLNNNDETVNEMIEIFRLAESYGIEKWLQFDVSVVRGLSYYTGMVFEGFSKTTALQRALCGGGRYDNLLESYGYPVKVPAVGFGMGDVVICEVLKELGRFPNLKQKCDYCIVPFKDLYSEGVFIAQQLRKKGYKVDIYMSNDKKMARAFSYADRSGVDKVILVAPSEYKKGLVVVKDLRKTHDNQFKVLISELLA